MHVPSILKSRWISLLALLLIVISLGVVIGNDYGMGSDENLNAVVGGRALRAMFSPEGYQLYLRTGESIGHHGPSYFMVFVAFSRFFTLIFKDWHLADGRHLTNYLTFILGVVLFYLLCLRLLPRRIALITTAVFATQPVLFGLGFINQKDTPFMVFFLASLMAGFWVTDRLGKIMGSGGVDPTSGSAIPIGQLIRQDWKAARRVWKLLLTLSITVFIVVLVDVLVFDQILAEMKHVMDLASEGIAWGPLNRLYELIAEDAQTTPVELYFEKLSWGYWVIGRMSLLLITLIANLFTAVRVLPSTMKRIFPGDWSLYLLAILAGSLLGFTISIRAIAGFVGLLVSGYWIYRYRERSIGLLLIYWVTAGVVSYETWPYLWETPLLSFVESLALHSDFRIHDVLYQGVTYPSNDLPWHFLPTLFALQITPFVTPIFLVGIYAAVRAVRRKEVDCAILLMISIWFVVPFAGTFLPGTVQFNNFRHMLFVIPPLFVFFGFGLKLIMDAVRSRWVRLLMVAVLLVPGIMGIINLHPYEYAYFNVYAGGIEGAYEDYDTEYWCTSFRKAMEYVNKNADPGATIFVSIPLYNAIPFASPDQYLTKLTGEYQDASYVIFCPHYAQSSVWAQGAKVFEVKHGSAIFAEVYEREPSTFENQME
jgi:hypothetical protein